MDKLEPGRAASLATSLFVEEYTSVRTEIANAYGFAQSIIGWSFAAFGVLVGGGLLAATAGTAVGTSAALMVFGIFTPALVWAAAIAWLGEVIRVERASAYLRWLELELAARRDIVDALGFPPIRFFLAAVRSGPIGQQVFTGLGAAFAFFIASALSDSLFLIVWTSPAAGLPTFHLVAAIAVELLGIAANFYAGSRVLGLRKSSLAGNVPWLPDREGKLRPRSS